MVSHPQPEQVPQRLAAPPSVRLAVKLMLAGAAASLANVAAWILSAGSVRLSASQLDPSLSSDELNTLVTRYLLVVVPYALAGVLLWLLMAWGSYRGKNWARVLSTVFFALSLIYTFGTVMISDVTIPLHGHTVSAFMSLPVYGSFLLPTAGKITAVLVCLAGLAATVVVWRPESNDYCAAVKQRRVDLAGVPANRQDYDASRYYL